MTETENKKKLNINRWIVVLLLVAIGLAASIFAPVRPVVMLPGEPLTDTLFTLPVVGDFKFTNTMLTTLIVDLILILMAVGVSRGIGDGSQAPKGLANVIDAILGALGDIVESTAGKKWARFIFPIMATIILMVLVSNLIKLVPGMETIGLMKEAHEHGYAKAVIIPGVLSYITDQEITLHAAEGEEVAAEESGHEEGEQVPYEVVPFFRSPSTDLNFTAALAVSAVVMVQVIGVKANGLGYFSKFLNVGRFVKMWGKKNLGPFDVIMPFIDIFVGILETISEFAKIISFSFRLLGSMFGGAILVIVIGSLMPVAHFGVLFLELFFGVIQALVFGMLTLVFMTVATQSHGSHEEGHGEAH
ncbi:MAG: F0F1 ATP synthase subunit A [Anaerolineales bacterium]|nr:F0F1 ATP synthase subunit A [Anaerolineales bacterium]